MFLVGAFQTVRPCRKRVRRATRTYSILDRMFDRMKDDAINYDDAINHDDAINQDGAIILEDGFQFQQFFGTDSSFNKDERRIRENLLQCFNCTSGEDSLDPNNTCFITQTGEPVDCPDLTYTSCFAAKSVTEIDGKVFFYMERGCSTDPVGIMTGINDTGETPDGRITGMDAIYTG